jgi:hypothetical protein
MKMQMNGVDFGGTTVAANGRFSLRGWKIESRRATADTTTMKCDCFLRT